MGLSTKNILNFINGELTEPHSKEYFININPATGEEIGQIPNSDKHDLDSATRAAKSAFKDWKLSSAEQRATLLNNLATLIENNIQQFAEAESLDTGKPIKLASTIDIPRSAANLRTFADNIENFHGQHFETQNAKSYTTRHPRGVVSTISPWNLPLLLFTWKLAPAIATGNCIIAKPSEITPITAFMLSQLINEAGFPPGVINILHGKGPDIGSLITDHPDISAISFTGGTNTGVAIYQSAAKNLKKVSLELGGKNPTIIFKDVDIDQAAEGAMRAAYTNQGQICLCGSRILIQEDIYKPFKEALINKIQNLKVGDPEDENSDLSAVVSEDHMNKVLSYIELARKEGGIILHGGERLSLSGRCENGYFIKPTLIENLSYDARVNQEEIFGPVATLIPFKNEDDAIKIANATQYGLAASIWTNNSDQSRRVAEAIETGIVWINCWNLRDLQTPFGGVKKSGIGREGVWRAFEFFTDEKTITQPMK
jgi:aminomuconate-semialdehyde/2-hydroxymuconate-6-semialdehyde dehydrogenase